jgi:hypothetical protein
MAATTQALALLRLGQTGASVGAARLAVRLLGDSPDDQRIAGVVGLRHSVVLHAAGDHEPAVWALRAALPLALESTPRDQEEAADALDAHAMLLAARAPGIAAYLLGAAHGLRSRIPNPVAAAPATMIQRTRRSSRRALGAARFDSAYRRGTRLDRTELLTACWAVLPARDHAGVAQPDHERHA